MTNLVPISEAKGRLSEIVRDAENEDVFLLRHGHIAAVIVSPERHEALVEEIEDLRDRLSIHEREGLTTDLDAVKTELGLNVPERDDAYWNRQAQRVEHWLGRRGLDAPSRKDWWYAPQPNLGGNSAFVAWRAGDYEQVMKLLDLEPD